MYTVLDIRKKIKTNYERFVLRIGLWKSFLEFENFKTPKKDTKFRANFSYEFRTLCAESMHTDYFRRETSV